MSTIYECRFVGRTPFIMDADNIELQDELKQWIKTHKGESTPGDDRTPPWAWKLKLHTDGTQLAIPCDMITAAIAGAANEITKNGKTTYKQDAVENLRPLDEYSPLLAGKQKKPILVKDIEAIEGDFAEQMAGVKKLGFRLFVKRARPGGRGGRHVRVRPRFEEYEFSVRLEVTNGKLDHSLVKMIAERMNSWGNWSRRQSHPGPFGDTKVYLKRIKG